MTLLESESFEGLANGVTLGTGNTAFDEITLGTGATAVATTTSPIDGSVSGLVTIGGSGGNYRLGWNTATITGPAYRLVAKMAFSSLTGNPNMMMIQAGGTRLTQCQINSNGSVTHWPTSAGNGVTTAAGIIVAGQPFRMEVWHDQATGECELRIWSNADDIGPADAITTPTANTAPTGSPTRVAPTWFAEAGAAGTTVRLDGIELHNDYWPADEPAVVSAPAAVTRFAAGWPGVTVGAILTSTGPALARFAASAPTMHAGVSIPATVNSPSAHARFAAATPNLHAGTRNPAAVQPPSAVARFQGFAPTISAGTPPAAIRAALAGPAVVDYNPAGPTPRRTITGTDTNTPELSETGTTRTITGPGV